MDRMPSRINMESPSGSNRQPFSHTAWSDPETSGPHFNAAVKLQCTESPNKQFEISHRLFLRFFSTSALPPLALREFSCAPSVFMGLKKYGGMPLQ